MDPTEAIESQDTQPEPSAPEPSTDQLALEAFGKGADNATPDDVPRPPAAEKPAEPARADAAAAQAQAAAAKPAEPAKPAEKPEDDEGKRKAAVDAEADSLGLRTAKTRQRFHQLNEEVHKGKTQITELTERAARAEERAGQIDAIVEASGAQPEQITNAFGVIQAMNYGTPAQKLKAANALLEWARPVFEAQGIEMPGGGTDPLKAYPDLAEAVETGEITRKFALEQAHLRATNAQNAEHSQRENEQRQWNEARDSAIEGINTLNDQLKAADPTGFAAKWSQFGGIFKREAERIQRTEHPSSWVASMKAAYDALPVPAAAPAPAAAPRAPAAPATPGPIRPNGSGAVVRKPQTDLEALELGFASVGG